VVAAEVEAEAETEAEAEEEEDKVVRTLQDLAQQLLLDT